MSLDELTWLFQRLGASDALNLDGGGSSAMVVDGAVVNRPSDREGERAVGNALALAACR
jgi:exopolysaccharide biosynthesis protein